MAGEFGAASTRLDVVGASTNMVIAYCQQFGSRDVRGKLQT